MTSFDEVSSSESMGAAHCEHEHEARVLLLMQGYSLIPPSQRKGVILPQPQTSTLPIYMIVISKALDPFPFLSFPLLSFSLFPNQTGYNNYERHVILTKAKRNETKREKLDMPFPLFLRHACIGVEVMKETGVLLFISSYLFTLHGLWIVKWK